MIQIFEMYFLWTVFPFCRSRDLMVGGGKKGWNRGWQKWRYSWKQRPEWFLGTEQRDSSLKCWINLWLSLSYFHGLAFSGLRAACPSRSLDPTIASTCLGSEQLGTAWLFTAFFPLNWEADMQNHYRKCSAAELHRPVSHLLLHRSPIVPPWPGLRV